MGTIDRDDPDPTEAYDPNLDFGLGLGEIDGGEDPDVHTSVLNEQMFEGAEEQGAPEILTIIKLEEELDRLDGVLSIRAAEPPGNPNAPIRQAADEAQADDSLQGVAVVLGLSFGGDVQMLVLAILSRYREIKGLR